MIREGIIKTICPSCFKIFDALERLDFIRCHKCAHEYELPKLKAKRIEDD